MYMHIYNQTINFKLIKALLTVFYQYREALVIKTLVSELGKNQIKVEKEDLEISGRIASSHVLVLGVMWPWRGIGVDRTTCARDYRSQK